MVIPLVGLGYHVSTALTLLRWGQGIRWFRAFAAGTNCLSNACRPRAEEPKKMLFGDQYNMYRYHLRARDEHQAISQGMLIVTFRLPAILVSSCNSRVQALIQGYSGTSDPAVTRS